MAALEHTLYYPQKLRDLWPDMNVGATEGSQIIQLFGRGVRLKGYGLSLKRSDKTDLPEGVTRPAHIGMLETLNIFGIHADYMAQFRDFLAEEGLPLNDERIELLLPVLRNLGTQKLKTIRLKKTINGVNTEFGTHFADSGRCRHWACRAATCRRTRWCSTGTRRSRR